MLESDVFICTLHLSLVSLTQQLGYVMFVMCNKQQTTITLSLQRYPSTSVVELDVEIYMEAPTLEKTKNTETTAMFLNQQ
jgi:hypothetical protein